MKTYTKKHSNRKALEAHLKKIKKRGGIAKTKVVKGGTQIDYYFPEKESRNKTRSYSDEAIAKYAGIKVGEFKHLHPTTKRELTDNKKYNR